MQTTPWKQTLLDDPVMADLVRRHGNVELVPAEDEFERLCVAIINQQLSTASAKAIRKRVFALLGDVTPATILAADTDELREAGLSRTKVEYLRNAAEAFRERDFTREALAEYTDEEVIDALTEIKGIGEWSAHMYLIFTLGREDVLPLGDLAVRRGIEELYGAADRAEMREIAESWRPYRSYGTLYVWEHYES
ncbi:DNA-3-methyladenine glycosylase family protein [Halopelagius longus]|uniref:DNA-3-methyladenine glycosylase 2 family protein n=1 Tax=Halopelagius longus TaxID=1236180 RepID=A0A1H0Z908_9EURY|nr:DNA-3-methyladenine glycosylase [Halopelagius longus]RDI72878.1 DNA-3-methyladenine glycosylase 2 family protein [Halopelagius longus]SDQ23606.1 DNA-3-methyladenine glycosylase II [Halopelagius longus]